MTIDELDTPALLLDLDAVERNLDRMAAGAERANVRLRPHAKTHKTAIVAKMQLARGAIGICCAKLGEAQALVDGGISDILITSELVGGAKIERAIGLAKRIDLTIVVDSIAVAAPLAQAAARAGIRLRTLVDVDIGQHRTGVSAGLPAIELARFIDAASGLELVGVQGYEGHLQHLTDPTLRAAAHARAMEDLSVTVDDFRRAGLATTIVTTGGTGTSPFAARYAAISDIQPGSYVVMDAQYGAVGGLDFEFALTVLSTVISVRGAAAILDAGYKSLSDDGGPPRPLAGRAQYSFAGDEFGKLTTFETHQRNVGDKVRLIPGHCDTTINVFDEYAVHRATTVIDRWPIVGRGQSR